MTDFIDDINVENIFSRVKFFHKALDALDRIIIRLSDGVVVLSERSQGLLQQDAFLGKRDKYAAIPCCVDTDRFNVEKEKKESDIKKELQLVDGSNLCYLGSVGTCYLFDKMLDFFMIWREHFKAAKFIIISQTQKDFILKEIAKNKIPADDIVILNLLPERIPYYLGLSRTSIMFIKAVDCKIGSSPTKFAESLIAGIPVCINKGIGDIDRFIREGRIGVTVDGFDKASYEKAISGLKELFLDSSLSSRCRDIASRYFSLEKGIEKYFDLYAYLKRRKNGL